MKKNKSIFWIIAVLLVLAVLYFILRVGAMTAYAPQTRPSSAPTPEIGSNLNRTLNPADIKYVKIGGKILKVELAESVTEQMQGLSGRRVLPPGEGMLFVFGAPGKYGFWMKDMKFPIDIIWLSQTGSVVYIKENASPDSYPETFSPPEAAKYVLEVNAGFSAENGLKIGDKAELLP